MAEVKVPKNFGGNLRPALRTWFRFGDRFARHILTNGSNPIPPAVAPMHPGPPASDDAYPPTRARHWVVALAGTLSVIVFVDRTCMSQAKVSMAAHTLAPGPPSVRTSRSRSAGEAPRASAEGRAATR